MGNNKSHQDAIKELIEIHNELFQLDSIKEISDAFVINEVNMKSFNVNTEDLVKKFEALCIAKKYFCFAYFLTNETYRVHLGNITTISNEIWGHGNYYDQVFQVTIEHIKEYEQIKNNNEESELEIESDSFWAEVTKKCSKKLKERKVFGNSFEKFCNYLCKKINAHEQSDYYYLFHIEKNKLVKSKISGPIQDDSNSISLEKHDINETLIGNYSFKTNLRTLIIEVSNSKDEIIVVVLRASDSDDFVRPVFGTRTLSSNKGIVTSHCLVIKSSILEEYDEEKIAFCLANDTTCMNMMADKALTNSLKSFDSNIDQDGGDNIFEKLLNNFINQSEFVSYTIINPNSETVFKNCWKFERQINTITVKRRGGKWGNWKGEAILHREYLYCYLNPIKNSSGSKRIVIVNLKTTSNSANLNFERGFEAISLGINSKSEMVSGLEILLAKEKKDLFEPEKIETKHFDEVPIEALSKLRSNLYASLSFLRLEEKQKHFNFPTSAKGEYDLYHYSLSKEELVDNTIIINEINGSLHARYQEGSHYLNEIYYYSNILYITFLHINNIVTFYIYIPLNLSDKPNYLLGTYTSNSLRSGSPTTQSILLLNKDKISEIEEQKESLKQKYCRTLKVKDGVEIIPNF